MTTRAQGTVLLLLGVIWAGLVAWTVLVAPDPQRAALKYVIGQAASREVGRGKASTGLRIRMDLLEAGRKRAAGTFMPPKNIFASLEPEDPETKFAKTHRLPPPVDMASLPPPGPTPEEMAAQAARAELGQFRYLGFLNRQSKSEAFLSKGKELHIVQTGDTIEQRVLVKAVTPASVTLQETRSQVEKAVLLAGEGR